MLALCKNPSWCTGMRAAIEPHSAKTNPFSLGLILSQVTLLQATGLKHLPNLALILSEDVITSRSNAVVARFRKKERKILKLILSRMISETRSSFIYEQSEITTTILRILRSPGCRRNPGASRAHPRLGVLRSCS